MTNGDKELMQPGARKESEQVAGS